MSKWRPLQKKNRIKLSVNISVNILDKLLSKFSKPTFLVARIKIKPALK